MSLWDTFWTTNSDGLDAGDVATFAGMLTVILGAIALVWRLVSPLFKKIFGSLEWLSDFRVSWEGTLPDPQQPWLPHTPGVMARLNRLDGEFADDGNGSLKSSVRRIEQTVNRIASRQGEIFDQIELLSDRVSELESPPPRARRAVKSNP